MSGPEQLTRPVAKRIAGLTPIAERPVEQSQVATPILDAATDALARGETHYTDRAGVLPLRKLVAEKLQARAGVTLDPKVVTITCGLAEARSIAIRVLGKPMTALVCPQMFADVIAIAHLVDMRAVPAAEPSGEVGLAYLTPADPPDVISSLVQSSAYIIWDMSVPGPAAHPAKDSGVAPRVTTVDGLDDVLPGWRVGWVAGSEMADRLRGFKQALTICTTSVSQWAAVEWLKSN